MVTLTVYPPAFGEPSASPFCVKSICMLSAAGVEYEIEETPDPRKAPKGKLPILDTSKDVVADSDEIRDYIERSYGIDFDIGLTEEQRATSRAVIRMLEEHVYFAIVCDRWANDANWAHVKRVFFSSIPFPINGLVTNHIRKQALGNLNGQGMGRLSDAERFRRVRKDIDVIKALLGRKRFLFGEDPSAADMSAVPFLCAATATPVETELSKHIRNDGDLQGYMMRGRRKLYPSDPDSGDRIWRTLDGENDAV